MDLSNFYNGGHIETVCMFSGCDQLKKIDIRNLDLSNIDFGDMFSCCDLDYEDIYPLNILQKAKVELENVYTVINDKAIKTFIELVFEEYL